MRNKRQFSVPDYVAHFCMFAKLCNLFMFWRHSLTYATVYGVLWLFQAYFLFQPVYNGPESVYYFHESNFAEVSCFFLTKLRYVNAISSSFNV